MKIHHLVAPPYYTNCFLLIGDDGHAVAIDPAASADKFSALLEEEGAELTHIFLTHAHHDHIGAVEPLRKKYGAKVYLHPADAKLFGLTPDVKFADGDKITVDDMNFEIISTPGHTPGSVCIKCGDVLFSGDTLFFRSIGRTDFEGSSMADMRDSLLKLCTLLPGDMQVLPGHEQFTTLEQEKQYNPFLRRM